MEKIDPIKVFEQRLIDLEKFENVTLEEIQNLSDPELRWRAYIMKKNYELNKTLLGLFGKTPTAAIH